MLEGRKKGVKNVKRKEESSSAIEILLHYTKFSC